LAALRAEAQAGWPGLTTAPAATRAELVRTRAVTPHPGTQRATASWRTKL
jgi:hypothetical protein